MDAMPHYWEEKGEFKVVTGARVDEPFVFFALHESITWFYD